MDGGTRSRPPFWLPDHRVGGGGEGTAQTPSPPPGSSQLHGGRAAERSAWREARSARRAALGEPGLQKSGVPRRIPELQEPKFPVQRIPELQEPNSPRSGPLAAPRGALPRVKVPSPPPELQEENIPAPRTSSISRSPFPGPGPFVAPEEQLPTRGPWELRPACAAPRAPQLEPRAARGGDSRSSAAAHRSETRRPAARLRRVNSGGSAKSCSGIVNCSSNASSRSLSANRSSRGEHRAGSRSAVAARIFSPHPVLQRSIRDVPSFQVKPHQAAPISVALGHSRAVGLRWERRDPPWFLSSVLRLCAALPGRSSGRRCAEGGSAAPPRCNWGAEFVGLLVLRSLGSHGGTQKAVAVLSPSLRAPFGLWGGRVATKERRKPSERRWNVKVRRAYGGGGLEGAAAF